MRRCLPWRYAPNNADGNNALLDDFSPAEGRAIYAFDTWRETGKSVVIGRRFLPIQDIEGDVGARHLIDAALVHEVEMEEDAILLDIDTPTLRISG